MDIEGACSLTYEPDRNSTGCGCRFEIKSKQSQARTSFQATLRQQLQHPEVAIINWACEHTWRCRWLLSHTSVREYWIFAPLDEGSVAHVLQL
jgi:hypothetical protein